MQWMFAWFATANSCVICGSSTSTSQVLAFSQPKLKYSSKENQEDKGRSACGVDYLWIDSIPCLIKYLLIFLKTNNPLIRKPCFFFSTLVPTLVLYSLPRPCDCCENRAPWDWVPFAEFEVFNHFLDTDKDHTSALYQRSSKLLWVSFTSFFELMYWVKVAAVSGSNGNDSGSKTTTFFPLSLCVFLFRLQDLDCLNF